ALEPAEPWQDIAVGPARSPGFFPCVIVARRATEEDQTVDAARTAEKPAAGKSDAPAAQCGFGRRLIRPEHAFVAHQPAEAERDAQPRGTKALPRLDQCDTRSGAGGEPRRQHATGRPGPDHDIVELRQ